MKNLMTDETRALIVAFFPDLLSLAVAFGVELSEERSRLIMSVMTKFIVFVFYIYKTGQKEGPAPGP